MKKTYCNLIAASLLLFTLALSCRKEQKVSSKPKTIEPTTTIEDTTFDKTKLNSVYADLKQIPQSFTVPAGVYKRIVGAKGTLLTFYKNSFRDKNGDIISTGTIDIKLTEVYSVGDMIAERMGTATANGLLVSGGEINIEATRNGEEVFANNYSIGFKQPKSSLEIMGVYYGNKNNEDSSVVWTPADSSIQGSLTVRTDDITDSSLAIFKTPMYLFGGCNQFRLLNCDHPYDSTSKFISINVVFPNNGFKSYYTTLGACYPSINVATILNANSSSNNTIKYRGYLPVRGDAKFVILASKNKQYYYLEYQCAVTGDITIDASAIAPISKEELLTRLKAL